MSSAGNIPPSTPGASELLSTPGAPRSNRAGLVGLTDEGRRLFGTPQNEKSVNQDIPSISPESLTEAEAKTGESQQMSPMKSEKKQQTGGKRRK